MPTWHKNLWFIVPYDRDGLARVWSMKSDPSSKDRSLAHSFLSKCFQVKAEVPEQVLSAWVQYCADCVEKSLIDWPKDSREKVVRTFQRHKSRLDQSPTPRQIHHFVNQVGLLGMRWGGTMSAESISLYALLRQHKTERELRAELLESGLPDAFEVNDINEAQHVKMEISGMLFGVDKNKGVQLLLTPDVKSAFISGNGDDIGNLIEIHGEAFWITWDAIKKDILPTSSHSEEYRIAFTKAFDKGMAQYRTRVNTEIQGLYEVWCTSTDSWDLDRFEYITSLTSLHNLVSDKSSYIEWCSRVISIKTTKLVSRIVDTELPDEHLTILENFIQFLEKLGSPLKPKVYNSLDKGKWIKWMSFLIRKNKNYPQVLPPPAIIQSFEQDLLANNHPNILVKTFDLDSDSDEWIPIANSCAAWASNQRRELGNNAVYVLTLKLWALGVVPVRDILTPALSGAPFWNRTRQESMDSIKILPILAACLFPSRLQNEPMLRDEIKQFWSQSSNTSEIINLVFETLKGINKLSVLWELAKHSPNKLAIQVIESNIEVMKLHAGPNGLPNLQTYWWINDTNSQIVKELCEQKEAAEGMEIIRSEPMAHSHAIYFLCEYGNEEMQEAVNDILQSLSVGDWFDCFENNNCILNCALKQDVSLDHRYKDAFESFYLKVINEGIEIEEWLWDYFIELFDKAIDKEILLQKFVQAFFSPANEQTIFEGVAFKTIKPHLLPYMKSANQDHLMVVLCDWLDQGKWEHIKWLAEADFKLKGKPHEALVTRLQAALSTASIDSSGILKVVFKMFKVTLPKKKNKK